MTYNKKIVIQKRTKTEDANGYPVETWESFYPCWASVNNLNSREFFAAMTEQAENSVMFFTRYFKKVEEMNPLDYRIFFKGKNYNITGIDNVGYQNQVVKFTAQEGLNNG
jgi:SPP1 family predicted phage head-tail adaptor